MAAGVRSRFIVTSYQLRRTRRRHDTTTRYVTRMKRGRIELKNVIQISELTLHRMVAGKYDWRDAGYVAREGKRRRIWNGARIWDPGD